MGKYTLQDDPAVDAVVERHLATIKDCLARLTRPQALFLYGSFGRGEGSVYRQGEDLRFFSDYEVGVIGFSPFLRAPVKDAERQLSAALPVAVSLSWFFPPRIHHNWLRNFSFREIPSIYIYELKNASQVFYGDFDFRRNPLDPRRLPLLEAYHLLKNRMMEVIEKWSGAAGDAGLAFSLAKLILACGDTLLLVNGLYHYSYRERARRFTDNYAQMFAGELGPEFLPLYQKAVSFKLFPYQEYQPQHILAHLAEIKPICRRTLDVLQRAGEDARYPSALMIQYENLFSAFKCRRAGRAIRWRDLPQSGKSYSLLQLLGNAITPLFFGLPIDGESDAGMLEQAAYWGRWMMRARPDPGEAFDRELVSSVCFMWHTLY